MKKKTKERLDRIEKRLEQLAEDIQKLNGLMHGTQSVKKKDVVAKTRRAKKVAVQIFWDGSSGTVKACPMVRLNNIISSSYSARVSATLC